jgi:hypothetical protein
MSLLLPSISALAAASYYRWVDDTGNTIMSDRPPPPGIEYKTISATMGTTHSAPAQSKDSEKSPDATRGEEFEAVPQVDVPIPKNPELCEQAKGNLDALQSARVRVKGENGEYRYIDEKEKAEQRKFAQDAIDAYCE